MIFFLINKILLKMSKINLKTGSKRSSVLLLFSFYNFSTAVATLVANGQSSILNGLMDSHVLCRVGQRGAVVEVPAGAVSAPRHVTHFHPVSTAGL